MRANGRLIGARQAYARQFLTLLSLLYPCGDCGREFGLLLEDFPPNVDSQNAFVEWMCAAHNRVNRRLSKPLFPCERVRERWQCGCASDL